MTDVRYALLTLSVLLLTLCMFGCISSPPVQGEDTTAQAQTQTEPVQSSTDTVADSESDPADQPDESDTTADTTEEQTTYGELHFPEE